MFSWKFTFIWAWILLMTEITWLAGHPLDHQRFLLAEDWEEQTGLAKRLREADSDKTNIDGLREAEDGRVESSEGSGGIVVTGHGELDLLHFFLPSLSLFLKCSGLALWGVLSTTLLLTSSLKFLCAWSTDVIRQGLGSVLSVLLLVSMPTRLDCRTLMTLAGNRAYAHLNYLLTSEAWVIESHRLCTSFHKTCRVLVVVLLLYSVSLKMNTIIWCTENLK